MNDTSKKHGNPNAAAWLLYVVSAIGLLTLLTTKTAGGQYSPLLWSDIIAYIVLAVAAVCIHTRVAGARIAYLILAIIWYALLCFYLAPVCGHPLDWYSIFMQLVITLLAYFVLFFAK